MAFTPAFGSVGMVYKSNRRGRSKRGTRKKTLFHVGLPPKTPGNPGAGTGSNSWKNRNINPLTVEGMRNIGRGASYAGRPYKNMKAYKQLSWKGRRAVDGIYQYLFSEVYNQTIGRLTDTSWESPFNVPFGPAYPQYKPRQSPFVRKKKYYRRKRRWR